MSYFRDLMMNQGGGEVAPYTAMTWIYSNGYASLGGSVSGVPLYTNIDMGLQYLSTTNPATWICRLNDASGNRTISINNGGGSTNTSICVFSRYFATYYSMHVFEDISLSLRTNSTNIYINGKSVVLNKMSYSGYATTAPTSILLTASSTYKLGYIIISNNVCDACLSFVPCKLVRNLKDSEKGNTSILGGVKGECGLWEQVSGKFYGCTTSGCTIYAE